MFTFDISKGERHSPSSTYLKANDRIRSSYTVCLHSDDLTSEKLDGYDALLLVSPREPLSNAEIDILRMFLTSGKGIGIFLSEEYDVDPNLGSFLKSYGIKGEVDCVLRTSYHRYLHPKQALISNGVLHPSLLDCNNRIDINRDKCKEDDSSDDKAEDSLESWENKETCGIESSGLDIVYPYGCTLEVQAPSVPILSSGITSFPVNRPLAAAWEDDSVLATTKKGGRLLVVGSSEIFADDWIDKEENSTLFDMIVNFLLHEGGVSFDRAMPLVGKVEEARCVPDIESLSGRLKSCLQECDPLPQDVGKLLCDDMVSYDTSLVPEVNDLYTKLGVKHEPLTLVRPEFECPIPPLKPAVFPPRMRDLPPPSLDQFDLDEEFAAPSERLAHLAIRCNDDDLEYYILEAGCMFESIGECNDAKEILCNVFQKV